MWEAATPIQKSCPSSRRDRNAFAAMRGYWTIVFKVRFCSDCQSDERTSLNAIGSCVVQSQKNAMRSFELTLSFKICF